MNLGGQDWRAENIHVLSKIQKLTTTCLFNVFSYHSLTLNTASTHNLTHLKTGANKNYMLPITNQPPSF